VFRAPLIPLITCVLLAAPAAAQDAAPRRTAPAAAAEAGSAYAVGGIKVDVSAKTPQAARFAAYRIAQRKAWPQLWAGLTGQPASRAPGLSDGQLDSIVAGIESQGERFSMTRYIATLGVVFDRSRVSRYVGSISGALQSAPMLLLPVWTDAGASTIYHSKTPWAAAWARFRENVTPVDYVLAPGTAADNVLLTGWQVRRPVRATWRTILSRYDTVDVLMAEARLVRSWPGGPMRADFAARHGPDYGLLGRFSLEAQSEDELPAMLDAAVRRIDALYATALRDGRLRIEAGLAVDLEPVIAPELFFEGPAVAGETVDDAVVIGTEVMVATPDAAALQAAEASIRRAGGVTAVTATSLSLGGSSRLLISHFGNVDALGAALAAQGLALSREDGRLVIRRGAPLPAVPPPAAPPPAAPPAPPVDLLPTPQQ
jgi:hypothetical protein